VASISYGVNRAVLGVVDPPADGADALVIADGHAGDRAQGDHEHDRRGEGEHDQSASRDAFDLLDRIVAARLRRRLTTVIDSTGLDRPSRDRWRAMASAAAVPCVAVVLDTPAPLCRRRNAVRDRPVPARVLAQQVAEFAALRPGLDDEGFDEVIVAEPVRVVAPSVAAAARAAPTVSEAASEAGGPVAPGLRG